MRPTQAIPSAPAEPAPTGHRHHATVPITPGTELTINAVRVRFGQNRHGRWAMHAISDDPLEVTIHQQPKKPTH
jgi:hypothetical protein